MSKITAVTSKEVVLGLQGNSRPDFKSWIWHSLVQGTLDLVIESIIRSGRANNPIEAIEYLGKYVQRVEVNEKVNLGDIQRTPINRKLHWTLNEFLTGEIHKGNYDSSRYFGVIGHLIIPELFSGSLIELSRVRQKHANMYEKQLSLFEKTELFNLNGAYVHRKVMHPRVWQCVTKRIDESWKHICEEFRRGNVVYHSKVYKKLRKDLRLVYGDHLMRIINSQRLQDEYLVFLTLMTWASALIYHNNEGRDTPLFKEAFILPQDYGLGVGKLDALLIKKINGLDPSPNEEYQIRKMTRIHFPSVGHIIQHLIGKFGTGLELVVRDWKFAVGDGLNGTNGNHNIIKTDGIVERPALEHKKQVERYLSTSVLAHSLLSRNNLKGIEEIWQNKAFNMKGELWYLMPDRSPVIHPVVLSDDEVKLVFQEQIAANYKSGLERSQVRSMGSLIMSHALNLLVGSGANHRTYHRFKSEQIVMALETSLLDTPRNRIQELVRPYLKKEFLDEHEIIEVVGRRKGEFKDVVTQMHLDILIKKVEDGTIDVPHGTNLAGGFFIKCFVHGEKTPSMRISPSGNVWKCFGCGIGGKFHPHSIPDQLHSVVNVRSLKKSASQILKVEIPKEHQEIMSTAQAILQNTFFGSKGFSYLTSRALKANESYERGAGFADLRLYKSLLDRGFNYSDLLKYGFVGISPKIGLFSPLVELLKSNGVSVSDMKQSVKSLLELGGEMKETDGLPYPMLWNMVTYPLEIGGVINSLYGRSVDPNVDRKHAHRKLKTADMPHGAWNMKNSLESKARFMIASEAPIDTDSFLQWSTADAGTGLVGVNNELLFEMMLGFPGDIVAGFDWDPSKINDKGKQVGLTGQLSTIKLARYMREHDFKYRVLDFTRGFVKAHPEIVYKDFNKFCMEHPQADKVDIMKYAIPVDENWLNV